MTFQKLKEKVIEFNPEYIKELDNTHNTQELIQCVAKVKNIIPTKALDHIIACI